MNGAMCFDNYFNVCWDKHRRILKWEEVVEAFKKHGK